MKKLFLFGALSVMVLMGSVAFADSIVGTGGWIGAWTAQQDGGEYWDNTSKDGSKKNIGYYLSNTGAFVGGSGPGVIPYWGNGGAADTSFYFSNQNSENIAAIKIEIAGLKDFNYFGWYELDTTGTVLGTSHNLFAGTQGAGAIATFTPTQNYGFYLTVYQDSTTPLHTFYTQSNLNTVASEQQVQHFAVFQDIFQDGISYWIGVEDLLSTDINYDADYNDFILKVAPVPEPATMLLLGTGLLGLAGLGRRKFFKKG